MAEWLSVSPHEIPCRHSAQIIPLARAEADSADFVPLDADLIFQPERKSLWL
jgi:hypothetical protein